MVWVFLHAGATPLPHFTAAQAGNSCQLAAPAFCETFSHPGGGGYRSQALPFYWGSSRVTGNVKLTSLASVCPQSVMSGCGNQQVTPEVNDIAVCNGEVFDSLDDAQSVAALAMYPKQPFDFAGRTGKITFDVSDDSAGTHA